MAGLRRGSRRFLSCLALTLALPSAIPSAQEENDRPLEIGIPLRIPVNPVIFAVGPEGNLVAAGTKNGIKVYDLRPGGRVRSVGDSLAGRCVAISPDGQFLAASAPIPGTHRVRVWTLPELTELATLPLDTYPVFLRFHPSDGTLLIGDGARNIQVWNVSQRRRVRTIPTRRGKGRMETIRFDVTPDGKLLIDYGLKLLLRNIKTGRVIRTLDTEGASTRSVSISPDGKLLATGGTRSNAVFIWDLGSGKLKAKLLGNKSGVACVRFARDGKIVLSAGAKSVLAWALDPPREIRIPRGPHTECSFLDVSPDGGRVFTAGQHSVYSWSPPTMAGKPVARTLPGRLSQIQDVSFSADGRFLAAVDRNHVVLWSLRDGTELRRFPLLNRRIPMESIAISPDRNSIVASSRQAGSIYVWNVKSGRLDTVPNAKGAGWLRFSPDGRYLAGKTEGIHVWNTKDFTLREVLAGARSGPQSGLAFSRDSTRLTSGMALESRVRVWTLGKTTTHLDIELEEMQAKVYGPALGPQGKWMAASVYVGDKHAVVVWNVTTGEEERRFSCDAPMSVAFLPDGRRIAYRSREGVHIASIETGEVTKTYPFPNPRRTDGRVLFLSPDGSEFIVLNEKEDVLRLWKLE